MSNIGLSDKRTKMSNIQTIIRKNEKKLNGKLKA